MNIAADTKTACVKITQTVTNIIVPETKRHYIFSPAD